MTVNYSFDLEDDDLLDDTFRSISENDLLSYSISSPLNINELKDFQAPSTSASININTDSNRKNSLSFLFKNRESVSADQKEIEYSIIHSPNKAVNTTTKINSRFAPGFTPKAKKKKLSGLTNFFSENPIDSESLVSKEATSHIEIKNITNSQFSSEDLLLSSWQNLQSEVTSCQNLLSTAKYYSIRRVLYETSKKKLPKHLVIPVLCVLIKKYNAEESSLVFMDDTGEISGKFDKEVFEMYKDAIQEGTALILKRVTCICNILFLKIQNLVSIYFVDGSVKHVQDLNSILDKEEPLKPMNCQCPGTPNEQTIKNPLLSKVCNSTPISPKKTGYTSHKMVKKVMESSYFNTKSPEENSCNMKNLNPSHCPQIPLGKDNVLNILEAMLEVSKSDCNSENSRPKSSLNHVTRETLKSSPNFAFVNSALCSTEIIKHSSTSKTLNNEKNSSNCLKPNQLKDTLNNQPFTESSLEEDLFCEDRDDFDEILCTLDEKSFLHEI